MEHIYILYFTQLFVFIPIMLTYMVSRYCRIPINNYSIEELILFGYFIMIYCSRSQDLPRNSRNVASTRIEYMY